MELPINQIICGNAFKILKTFPDESIDCVVTSPPYWALRDYQLEPQIWDDGWQGTLGLEPTFELYIKHLCDIFDEIKRVLKKTGTCWVNMGDTYGGAQGKNQGYPDSETKALIPQQIKMRGYAKCLLQLPSRFAIEMVNRGWILRNEIIWHKPNCMPSSVKDRFTIDFEKIFFFVKNKKYWFETQYEPYKGPINRWGGNYFNYRVRDSEKKSKICPQFKATKEEIEMYPESQRAFLRNRNMRPNKKGRNKRCIWRIATQPLEIKKDHFAVFPEELCKTPIKAGCPKNGTVLDPFVGSGTACLVAKKLGRNYIGIDLSSKFCEMAQKRINSILL